MVDYDSFIVQFIRMYCTQMGCAAEQHDLGGGQPKATLKMYFKNSTNPYILGNLSYELLFSS